MKRLLPLLVLLTLIAPRAEALCIGVVVATTPVLFGVYNPFGSSPVDSSGEVAVTCALGLGVNYTIKLGTGGSGSYSPRKLSAGAQTLNYNLYTDAAHSTVWGDGSGSTGTRGFSGTLAIVGLRTYTVYGRIPSGQNVAAGAYTDTLTVTVEY